MVNDQTLQPVVEQGWTSGFANLLRKENSLWWQTRRWWVQILVWLVISNGLIGFILWAIPALESSEGMPTTAGAMLSIFINMQSTFAMIGTLVLSQGLIVNEKKFGTAAWVLSNPVSRAALVLSKLVGQGLALLVIVMAVQGLVMYLQVALKLQSFADPLPFIAAMAIIYLLMLFYLSLSLLLGTLFNSTGPVIGIGIATLFGQTILAQLLAKQAPWLAYVLPDSLGRLAETVTLGGQALPEGWYWPLISTAVLTVLCIAGAILRLSREEF
jgi:ABC-2 type transport system permease protein